MYISKWWGDLIVCSDDSLTGWIMSARREQILADSFEAVALNRIDSPLDSGVLYKHYDKERPIVVVDDPFRSKALSCSIL